MNYYLKVGDNDWIKVNGFNFTVATDIMAQPGSTAYTGDVDFRAVNLQLGSDALLPLLLKSSLTGTASNVVLRVTETSSNPAIGEQAVYDMQLSGAFVTELQDTAFDGYGLKLLYSEIAVTTYAKDALGVSVPSGSFDWDVQTDDTSPENIPAIPPLTAPLDLNPAKFVMAIDGIGGSSTFAGRKGWFDIDSFSFKTATAVDVSSGASAMIGKAENFGFTVALRDQTALTALLSLAANGSVIKSVEIEGYSITNAPQTESLFGNVFINGISEDSENGYLVEFGYSQIKTSTFGAGGLAQAVSYDFTSGKEQFSSAAPTPGFSFATNAPTKYFLALTGLTGDATAPSHQGWFNIDLMDFGLGGGVGMIPNFSDVGLRLSSDNQAGRLMQQMADGKTFNGATISGVDGKGNVVYTLDLGNVNISQLVDDGERGFWLDLDFRKFELTTQGYNSLGSLKANPSFGWDLDTNTPLASLASAKPSSSTPEAAIAPTKYYMIVDGMNGGVTNASYANWFELPGFKFEGSAFGLNSDFKPLVAYLESDKGLTAMLSAATAGTSIAGLRIEGVANVGGIEKKVYELALTDVAVQNVTDVGGSGYTASFDFGKFATRTFDAVTGLQTSVGGWDRVTETVSTSKAFLKASTGLAEAQADVLFFGSPDFASDSQVAGFKQYSRIEGYEFGVNQATNRGQAFGLDGIDRMTLIFASDTDLPQFLTALTKGVTIGNASIVGADFLSGTFQKVMDVNLENILVTSVNDFASGGFSVELDFTAFQISQRRIDPVTSKLGASNSFGWDIEFDMPTTVNGVKGDSPEPVVSPISYFMAVDGWQGDQTGAARGGWFKVADMTFSGTNSGSSSTGGGGGGGKFELNAITLIVDSDQGLTQFLDAMTNSVPINGVQIEATALNASNAARTVQTLGLGEVYVAGVTDFDGPGYLVKLEASRFNLSNFSLAGDLITGSFYDVEFNKAQNPNVIANPAGSAGNDTLAGGRTNSLLNGGLGNDWLYGNDGNDTLNGEDGNDRLFGGNGNDILSGGNNNDILIGGAGRDTLTGGGGKDTFQYKLASDSTPGVNRDVITDFVFDSDVIDLSAISPAVLTWIADGAAFTGVNQVRAIDSPTDPDLDTVIQINLSGDVTPEMEIYIKNQGFGSFLAIDFIL